ncbi:MAG: glutaminase [Psychrobacter sp.]|uniref:glutaminase n=1 Tax=Psychrobacter sp. TaxID=56811 RepID=UPI0026474AB1|nr:glutaminase [Psychrobacter sp.]MDN5621206.1 glutaminase [Psychrobacter sp.]
MMDIQKILDDIATKMANETDRGKVADYIPQLAHVNPNQFGIAVATPDGQVYTAGDTGTLFSIQSISKVFTLGCV